MSQSKHTPGPWTPHRYECEPGSACPWAGWHIKQPNSGLTDVAYVDDVDYGPATAEVNARLIAAAPDLLAACLAVLDRHSYQGDGQPWAQLFVTVRQAVTKATEG